MAKIGRPTIRTPEIEDEICERLTLGETLRAMCRNHAHMPDRYTVARWQASDAAFCDRIVRAREAGSHELIDEAREIADTPKRLVKETIREGKDGEDVIEKVITDDVNRDRLRIDQRWREAEAILPKVYGKRQTIEHAGGLNISLTNTSDEDLVNEIAELLATGRLKLPAGIELVDVEAEDEEDFSDIA